MTTNDNFDRAFEYVVRNEGGYTNHSGDSGGATNYGITIGTLRRWRENLTLTPKDVGELTRDEAKAIYRKWYWDTVNGDRLPLVVATVMFDAGVLFGVKIASIIAQRALWATGAQGIADDGLIGPKSIAALTAVDQAKFIGVVQKLLNERVTELIGVPKNKAFEKGWRARIDRFSTLLAA